MRHGKSFNNLGRKKGHRDATLQALSNALIRHKRINTTLAKAKALRKHIEPIITKAKNNTTHSRRVVFSYLQDKEIVHTLFLDIAAKVGDRPGGYTRVIRTGFRKGDGAEMAMIELVDYNEVMLAGKEESTSRRGRTRRSRRGGGSKSTADKSAGTAVAATTSGEEE